MYKIFINDIPLTIMSTEDLKLGDVKHSSSLVCKYDGTMKQLKGYIEILEGSNFITSMVIHSPNFEKLKKDFLSFYTIIEAAGGLIMNDDQEYLFIFRRGHWDLPKGKIDKNEKKKAAAIREVMEETAVKNVEIQGKISTSYHTYKLKNTRILKKTHWYLMHTHNQKLKPQREEDITKALWMTIEDFEKCTPAYGNIIQTIEEYRRIYGNGSEVEIDHLI